MLYPLQHPGLLFRFMKTRIAGGRLVSVISRIEWCNVEIHVLWRSHCLLNLKELSCLHVRECSDVDSSCEPCNFRLEAQGGFVHTTASCCIRHTLILLISLRASTLSQFPEANK